MADTRENLRTRLPDAPAFREVPIENLRQYRRHEHDTILSSLPEPNMERPILRVDVSHLELEKLPAPKAGVQGGRDKGVVPGTFEARVVGVVGDALEESLGLLDRKVRRDAPADLG